MHRTLLCIVLPLAVVLSACSVVPNAPANKPPVNPLEIDLSTLDLKVLVPYSVIAHELNRAIENELYWVSGQQFDCPVTECSFQVRVLRAGDISVRPDNSGQLVLSMPIRTSDGRIDAAQDLLFGKKAKAKADLTATITATATIDFELNPDWSSKPNVSLAFQVRRAGAHVSIPIIGSVYISAKSHLRRLLNGQKGRLESVIRNALDNRVDVRSEAANAWRQLHTTLRMNDQPPVWLVADPVSLKIENPRAEADGLRMAMGIDAYLSTYAQQDEPVTPKPEALPNLQVLPNIAGRYKFSVPIRASVEKINQQVNKLIGKTFTFKATGRTITAKLIDGRIHTNGPDLVVYAEVRAVKMLLGVLPIRVGAYLNGTPKYDAKSTTVHLDPLDYDADTNNLLLDKAEWFFHGSIRESIQAALRLNIGEEINHARQLIAEKLRDMPIGNGIVLSGTVDKLVPRAIYTTKDALNVDALAEGRINVELQPPSSRDQSGQ